MAKVSFTKIKIPTSLTSENAQLIMGEGDSQVIIEVKNHLPVEERLHIMERALNHLDTTTFRNPLLSTIFIHLEIIYAYTNLSFTEKQKENFLDTFEKLDTSGFLAKFYELCNQQEIQSLLKYFFDTLTSILEYNTSLKGIMEAVSQDASGLAEEAERIKQILSNPQNLELLKNISDKLG